ncbi:hypothetical protein B484DRAFT_389810 [Ochromonadaceae sp. CCMP2298]|nr:hypothetical protein B484DRAFT_389810 [Ochromonadaceae sp. CCMP2298]
MKNFDNASDSSDDEFEDRLIESIILQEDCDADLERLSAEELDIAWISEGSLPELRDQWGMELPIYVQFEETFSAKSLSSDAEESTPLPSSAPLKPSCSD